MWAFIDKVPTSTFLIVALTLGLSPFVPEPHLWEKLKMLANGTLTKPLDIFDMFFHGAPWLLLSIKVARARQQGQQGQQGNQSQPEQASGQDAQE